MYIACTQAHFNRQHPLNNPGGGGVLPYKPKGMVFVPFCLFGLKKGIDFDHVDLK